MPVSFLKTQQPQSTISNPTMPRGQNHIPSPDTAEDVEVTSITMSEVGANEVDNKQFHHGPQVSRTAEPPNPQANLSPHRLTENLLGHIKNLTVPHVSQHQRSPSPARKTATLSPTPASPLPSSTKRAAFLRVPSPRPGANSRSRSPSRSPNFGSRGVHSQQGTEPSYCHWKPEDHKHRMMMEWLNRR